MHSRMSRQTFQTFCRIDQPLNLWVFLIHLAQIRAHFQSQIQCHAKIIRHCLCDGIHIIVWHIHDTPNVSDDALCLEGSEGDDLGHTVLAIFFNNIINNLASTVEAEVDINIRHGYTFRVQKSLKQKIVADGIDIGDTGRIGNQASGCTASSRSYRDMMGSGIIDKIPDDQKIIHIAHLLDGL